MLLGWFFVPVYLSSGIYTMPEFLEYRYDAGARTIMAVFLMIAYIVVFLATVLFSGSDNGDASSSSARGNSNSAPTSASSAPAAAAAPAELTACQRRHDEQLVLELTSPEVQPTIPIAYSKSVAYPEGFPTPALNWSAVPPETTEIAILILQLTDERAAAYAADPTLWWGTPDSSRSNVPTGSIR